MPATAAPPSRSALLGRLLRLVGLVALVPATLGSRLWHHGPWVVAALLVCGAAWLIWVAVPAGRAGPPIERGALLVIVTLSSLVAGYFGIALIVVCVAIFASVAQLQFSPNFGGAVVGVAVLALCLSALLSHAGLGSLLSAFASVLVAGVMGLSRRQFRVGAEQNRLLVEQARQIRAERDRAAALTERGRIARDVHDVLAHTLGGLVLQLEAADALLEAGRPEQAAARVRSARELAGSGLDEARRVVGALRADYRDLRSELERTVEAHRAVGADVSLSVHGDVHGLDEQLVVALARAGQECLTNARKHAPGAAVRLTVRVETAAVILESANPTARVGIPLPGAGAGLLGMRERIGALAGTVEAGKEATEWIVRIRAPRS